MKFPIRELEIVQLAQDVSTGLTANPDTFPAPPIPVATIEEAVAAYTTARESSVAALARAKADKTAKKEALDRVASLVRFNLRYAEAVADGNGDTLQLLGWGRRRKPVRNEQIEPGQVVTLEVEQEGISWVTLAWQAPYDGGTVAAYRIQRRQRDGGDWTDVATAVEPFMKLEGQPTGIELEYHVIGVNATGDGPASNIVRVVL